VNRKLFVATSLSALSLTGCSAFDGAKNALSQGPLFNGLKGTDRLTHAVLGSHGMAREYPDSAIDHDYRTNGNSTPTSSQYQALVQHRFGDYKLVVDGLVDRPQAFTLPHLRAIGDVTQTTRHDCVEGWSIVGKWRGPQLGTILAMVQPKAEARYCVFHCYDADDQGTIFYGSIDLKAAAHPQTLLALDLNDKPLDPDHGAPVRLRIPIQLGYKSTKWINRVELVASYKTIGQGHGGYWEDNGYDWYAGA
jgi:DMSO/TMAO reductase YedYZ molybdopterin-dependent catalytic subunit